MVKNGVDLAAELIVVVVDAFVAVATGGQFYKVLYDGGYVASEVVVVVSGVVVYVVAGAAGCYTAALVFD